MQWQSKYNKRKEKATNARKERKLGLATKKGKLRPKIKAMTMGVKDTIPKNVYFVYLRNKNKKYALISFDSICGCNRGCSVGTMVHPITRGSEEGLERTGKFNPAATMI